MEPTVRLSVVLRKGGLLTLMLAAVFILSNHFNPQGYVVHPLLCGTMIIAGLGFYLMGRQIAAKYRDHSDEL